MVRVTRVRNLSIEGEGAVALAQLQQFKSFVRVAQFAMQSLNWLVLRLNLSEDLRQLGLPPIGRFLFFYLQPFVLRRTLWPVGVQPALPFRHLTGVARHLILPSVRFRFALGLQIALPLLEVADAFAAAALAFHHILLRPQGALLAIFTRVVVVVRLFEGPVLGLGTRRTVVHR